MRSTPTLIFVLLLVFWCFGCSEDDPEPQKPEDVEDITNSAEITPYGGELEVTDESGNVITLSFPPGSIKDTTTVILTILGKQIDLPINEKNIRAFEIQPSDLSLYRPVTITIKFNNVIGEIEKSALYRMRSNDWLIPLSDQTYPDGKSSIIANTLILGEFSEGKMTIDQISAQLNLLAASMGITLKSSHLSTTDYLKSTGCEEYKAQWDSGMETAAAFFKFFEMREILGYYNEQPGRGSFDEDVKKVCENIIEQAVKDVLDLGEPGDPCCSDYAHSIESMMKAMSGCGSQTSTFDQLNDQYNTVHSQCHTYLDITTEVNIESGGLLIMNTGEVMLTLEGTGGGEASVTGTGELVVAGSGNAGGECSATIAGQTFVKVTGTRDAAYIYTLTIDMDQYANMITVCPDIVVQTPLVGGSSRSVTLGPGNGFSISETEIIDEGTATVQGSINNPYVPVPDPE